MNTASGSRAGFHALLITAALAWLPGFSMAQTATTNIPADIQEWSVPWDSTRPRDPYLAPDGLVWFVGQGGDYAARFDPNSEEFERFELPEGTGPHNLIVAADGSVWYAGNRNAHIGHLNPDDGSIQRFPTPEDQAKDPHTLHFAADGRIWFTAQWSNRIGRLDPTSGSVELVEMPVERARPYGIDLDSSGHAWVVLLGTNRLARVDKNNFELSTYELPRTGARPRRIAITSDDLIWYVDYQEGYIGRFDPSDQSFKEWRAPGADKSGPYAMGADQRDRLWFVETWQKPNRFVGFDPQTENFFSLTEIPSGGGAVRHMYYDSNSNSFWFGTDTNQLGQARLPE